MNSGAHKTHTSIHFLLWFERDGWAIHFYLRTIGDWPRLKMKRKKKNPEQITKR